MMTEGADKDEVVKIMKQMNESRKTHHDVIIQVEGQAFPCHRHVVAAGCPSLQPILLKHEWNCDNPTLHDIEPKIFEVILEYVYTGVIHITAMNGFNLLKTANYLLMDTLVKKCKDFLSKICPPKDLVQVHEFACSVLNDAEFVSNLEKQLARNLSLVYNSKEFTKISLTTLESILKTKQQIIKAQGDSYGEFVSEFGDRDANNKSGVFKVRRIQKSHKADFFPAILNWVGGDVVERMQYLSQLFWYTDLPFLITRGLRVLLTSYSTGLTKKIVRDLKMNASEYSDVSVSVHTIDHNQVKTLTYDTNNWLCVNEFNIRASNLRTVVKNKQLFYLAYNALRSENYFWTGTGKNMENLCPPPFYVSDYELVATNDVIYLLNSNETVQPRKDLETKMEFSNLNAFVKDWNKWIPLPSSPKILYHSYFTSWNNLLYVIGGNALYNEEGNSHNIIQQYDPRTSKWLEIDSDVKLRLKGGVCAYGGKIYICEKEDSSLLNSYNLKLLIFDIEANKWESVSHKNDVGFSPTALIPHQNRLLNFSHDPSKGLMVYDCDKREWSNELQKLPEELCNNKTCEIKGASVC